MSRHKLIVAACVLVVLAGTAVAARASHQHQQNVAAQAAVAAKQQQNQTRALNTRLQNDQTSISNLTTDCVTGQKAFDALTVVQRQALAKQGVSRASCRP